MQSLTFTASVAVPATAVYYALTNATALQEWLCNTAQTQVRENGSVFLSWNQGYYMSGEFVDVVPNQSFGLVWQGRGELHASRVDVVLAENGGETAVTLTHSNLGKGEAWAQTVAELKNGWEGGLANLKSTLETGLDKRVFDQPFLGVLIAGLVTAEQAVEMGLPIAGGVKISGTAPGSGAAAIGLQPDDILATLAGHELVNFQAIRPALAPYKAGEKVKLIYYRGGEQMTDLLELSRRPMPGVPETAVSFAQALREIYAQQDAQLDDLLDGVGEAEASFRLEPDGWNVKEHLAHLLGTERVTQIGIAMQLSDQALNGFPNNPAAWTAGITAVNPTPATFCAAAA
ncbi:MAG: SRPBCC domain-containing protein [Anaerolineales bacterium]|nr:SRPBCC domain-containing protein [Anaerolineales bacterium]